MIYRPKQKEPQKEPDRDSVRPAVTRMNSRV
jgi:hypothetical protein